MQGGAAAGAGAIAPAGAAEMDLATVLATFPADVREEVLLTADDDLINTLPPAQLAEAQELRNRVLSRGAAFRCEPALSARKCGSCQLQALSSANCSITVQPLTELSKCHWPCSCPAGTNQCF